MFIMKLKELSDFISKKLPENSAAMIGYAENFFGDAIIITDGIHTIEIEEGLIYQWILSLKNNVTTQAQLKVEKSHNHNKDLELIMDFINDNMSLKSTPLSAPTPVKNKNNKSTHSNNNNNNNIK